MKIINSFMTFEKPVFVVINTSEYNNDNTYAVQIVEMDKDDEELLGFDTIETLDGVDIETSKAIDSNITNLKVGQCLKASFYNGAYVMRIK